jgi:hypothetical protein
MLSPGVIIGLTVVLVFSNVGGTPLAQPTPTAPTSMPAPATLTPTTTPPTPTATSVPALPILTDGVDSWRLTTIVTVTVTNSSDVVNGDTSNITALTSNPGPDGISFREALNASNGTSGEKSIVFHPSLSGTTITFVPYGLLLLASGVLTINGDINQDGQPDITLDGHLGQPALGIVSSDNIIEGLKFVDFFVAVAIPCPDAGCGSRLFSNNRIINNIILSQGGAGIQITTLGLLPVEEAPLLSDITWQNTIIGGNTIVTQQCAICIASAVGGGKRNQIINLTISGNHLSSGEAAALSIMVADVNSAWFGIPGPIIYSDDNLIDNLTITDNVIESSYRGIDISGANDGNSANQMQNVTIKNNTITNIVSAGFSLTVGDGRSEERGSDNNLIDNLTITDNMIETSFIGIHIIGAIDDNNDNLLRNTRIISNTITNIAWAGISLSAGSGKSDERGTDNNGLEGVEIRDNTIAQVWSGITITGGHGIGSRNNWMRNVLIADNAISDYTGVGIFLMGGDTGSNEVSDNLLDQVIISGNNLQQTVNQGSGAGVVVIGGNSIGGLSRRNIVRGLYILNNQISHNSTGLQIFGGSGIGAEDNQVFIVDISGNMLVGNNLPSDIRDNDQEAIGNAVIFLSARLYLPLIIR